MAEKHVHKVYGSFPPWGKSVEFPASGGGGGADWIYLDIRGLYGEDLASFLETAFIVQKTSGDATQVTVYNWTRQNATPAEYPAIGISNVLLKNLWVDENTMQDMKLVDMMRANPKFDSIPQLTEEQFYSGKFDAIAIYKDGEVLYLNYDEGSTWEEWINSKHNTIGLGGSGDFISSSDGNLVLMENISGQVDSTSFVMKSNPIDVRSRLILLPNS